MATFKVLKDMSGNRYGVLSGETTKDYYENGNLYSNISKYESLDFAISGCYNYDKRPWVTEVLNSSGLSEAVNVCASFKKVIIKKNVKSIGKSFFLLFKNAEFVFEDFSALTVIDSQAFTMSGIGGELTLSENLVTLGGMAFADCANLIKVDLSKTPLTELKSSTFALCENLSEIVLNQSITNIGMCAFSRSTKITADGVKNLSDNIQQVQSCAFHNTGVKQLKTANGTIVSEECFVDRDSLDAIGVTTGQKFAPEMIQQIQSVKLPNTVKLPKHISNQNYPNIPYGILGDKQQYLSEGCMILSLYHTYQKLFPNATFTNSVEEFWNEVNQRWKQHKNEYASYDGYADVENIYDLQRGWGFFRIIVELLGLEFKDFGTVKDSDGSLKYMDKLFDNGFGDQVKLLRYGEDAIIYKDTFRLLTDTEHAKKEIAEALSKGYGIMAEVSLSPGTLGQLTQPFTKLGKTFEAGQKYMLNSHQVAIVGAENDKLIVVDSALHGGNSTQIYKINYEDLFCGRFGWNDIMIVAKKGTF